MEELKVLKSNAVAAYNQADQTGKVLLRNLLGKKHFDIPIAEWEDYIMRVVTSFENACAEVGEDPADTKFFTGEPDEIAYKKGKVVVLALNGSWERDWSDSEQRKWEAWLKHTDAGFRFHATYYGLSGTDTTSGSRLRLCSAVLAKYFVEKFGDMMQPFWL